jgi:hypothetical protein
MQEDSDKEDKNLLDTANLQETIPTVQQNQDNNHNALDNPSTENPPYNK